MQIDILKLQPKAWELYLRVDVAPKHQKNGDLQRKSYYKHYVSELP
jgi:hypothetical protein